MLDRIDLAAIKAAAAGATKGPCVYYGVDHEFIALCDPATLLALVAAVEAAQRCLDEATADTYLVGIEDLATALVPFRYRPPEAPHG